MALSRFDGAGWSEYVQQFVTPDFQRFGDVVRDRILPVFDGINREADAFAQRRYDELMSQPASEDGDDGSVMADIAMNDGFEHFDMLDSMRNATLNLYSAALYHLTEQHVVDLCLMILYRSHDREEIKPQEAFTFLRDEVGLEVKSLSNWRDIYELRLVANAVKHGEGHSAEELHALRPDLFQVPQLKALGMSSSARMRVRKPLFGEDIYVTANDFNRYHGASVGFWSEIGDAFPALTR